MRSFVSSLKSFFVAEEGASLVEYALLIALIALACVAALTLTGSSISAMFTRINGKLATVAT